VHYFWDALGGDVNQQVRPFRCFVLRTNSRQPTQLSPSGTSVDLSPVGHLGVFYWSSDMNVENVCTRPCTMQHRLQELMLILPLGRQGRNDDRSTGTRQFGSEERDATEIFGHLARSFQVVIQNEGD